MATQPIPQPEQPAVAPSPLATVPHTSWMQDLFAPTQTPVFASTEIDHTIEPGVMEPTGSVPAQEPPPDVEPAAPEPEPVAPEAAPLNADKQKVYEDIYADLKKQHPELEAANPSLLKRMADDRLYLRELTEKTKEQSHQISQLLERVTKKEVSPQETLTEFERQLAAATAPVQPEPVREQPQQPQAQPQQPQMPALEYAPRWVADPTRAYEDENSAWTDYVNGEKTPEERMQAANRLHRIRQEMIYLSTLPLVTKIQELESQLGQVSSFMPVVQESMAERQVRESHEFALGQLRQQYPDIDTFFVPSGEDLVVNGKKVDNSPFNQLALEFPEILEVRVQHKDPATAQRLTLIARYRAAERYAKMKSLSAASTQSTNGTPTLPAEKAVELQAAAAAVAQRNEQDRVRQGLNSGPGATQVGAPPADKGEFLRGWDTSRPVRLDDLFK